ncbi:hypothetical protein SLS55_008235 [Diplodia seriata]|uniref:Xylanolytic transcriptional activator regulatory domain-containing protein n=1 Tax=Diplodia seriata TaxID=420778 RepID=A0ABR3C9W9_9PEZI
MADRLPASSFNMPFTTMNNYNWLFDVDLGAPAAQHFSASTPDILSDEQHSVSGTTIGRSQTTNVLTPLSIPVEERVRAVRDSLAARQAHLGIDFERPMSSMNRSASLPVIDEVARAQVLDVIEAARPITPDGLYISRNHPLLSLSSLQTYCDLYFTRFNTAYPLIHQPTFDASHVETLLLVSVLLLGATYCEKDAHQMAVCIHDVLRPQIFAHAGFNAKPDLWVLQTILLVECFGKSRAGQKQHDMAHLFHGLLINLIRRSDCQTIRTLFTDECSGDLDNDWKRWAEAEQKKRLAYLCFLWDVQHAVLFCQSLCMSAFELRSNLPCNQQLWEADSAELWQRLRKKQRSPPLFLSLVKAYLTPGGPPIPRNLNALSRLLLLHGLMSISWDMKRRDQTSLGLVGGRVGSKQSPIGDWKTRMSTSYNTWKADFDTYCANYLDLFCSGPENPNSSSSNSNSNPSPLRQEFVTWATANAAVYHAAHVLLNAEFLDLQIYAGARHILGRPVGRADYVRSQRVVKRWAGAGAAGAGSSSAGGEAVDDEVERLRAARAARHAALLIREGVERLDAFDAGGLFHYPWCLYLATLTCWAWWHARPQQQQQQHPAPPLAVQQQQRQRQQRQRRVEAEAMMDPDAEEFDGVDVPSDENEDEMVWDAAAELDALVGCMTSLPLSSSSSSSAAATNHHHHHNSASSPASASAITPSSSSNGGGGGVVAAVSSSKKRRSRHGCSSSSDMQDDDDDVFAAERQLEAVARALRPAVVRRRTTGLTAVVARHLSKVRWAVVHDGMMVLKGLVPWRMIGGAEGLA